MRRILNNLHPINAEKYVPSLKSLRMILKPRFFRGRAEPRVELDRSEKSRLDLCLIHSLPSVSVHSSEGLLLKMFKPGGLLGPRQTPGRMALDQMSGGGDGGSGKDDKGGSKDKKEEKSYSGSGFDPRGLERAAKAAQVSLCVHRSSLR